MKCTKDLDNNFTKGKEYPVILNHRNITAVADNLGYKTFFRKNGKYNPEDDELVGVHCAVKYSLIDYFDFEEKLTEVGNVSRIY